MNSKTIDFLAAVACIIGLSGLALMAATLRPTQKSPYAFEDKDYVLVKGKVTYSSVTEKASFLTVIPEDEVEVVLFNPYAPRKGQTIEVIGTVTRDAQGMSITAEKLKILS